MSVEPVAFVCNEAEARTLTDDIRRGVEKVHTLLVRSYEWRAWDALGYATWRDYAMTEFGISKSRAYQLLDQARVIREIEAVAGDSTIVELDESQTRELAPIVRDHGPEAAAAVLTAVAESGKPTAAAIRAEATDRGLRPTPKPVEDRAPRPSLIVVDPDTGEIVDLEAAAAARKAENERRANLRQRFEDLAFAVAVIESHCGHDDIRAEFRDAWNANPDLRPDLPRDRNMRAARLREAARLLDTLANEWRTP